MNVCVLPIRATLEQGEEKEPVDMAGKHHADSLASHESLVGPRGLPGVLRSSLV